MEKRRRSSLQRQVETESHLSHLLMQKEPFQVAMEIKEPKQHDSHELGQGHAFSSHNSDCNYY